MSIRVMCGDCRTKLDVPGHLTGSSVTCPICAARVDVDPPRLAKPVGRTGTERDTVYVVRRPRRSDRAGRGSWFGRHVAELFIAVFGAVVASLLTAWLGFGGPPTPPPRPTAYAAPAPFASPTRHPTVSSPPTYLADLKPYQRDVMTFETLPRTVGRRSYTKAVFTHPYDNRTAQVSYRLGRQWQTFEGKVGIPDDTNAYRGPDTTLRFAVLVDGVEVWASGPVRAPGRPQSFAVPVTGAETLTLVVQCPGSAFCAHACWLDPLLK